MAAQYTEAIEVRIHNIDVIVTDRAGNAVTGLRKDDFELLEDGKRQTITNFAAYSDRVATVSAPAAAPAPSAPSAAAPVAVVAPPPRRIVFYVDEMSMHPSNRATFIKSANGMLDQVMRPGDEAMLVRPAAGVTLRLAFTSDRDAVRAELTKAIEASTHRADIAFESQWRRFAADARQAVDIRDLRKIARRHAAYVRRRVEQRLANLRAVIATMAPIEGRKVLVTVAESLAAEPGKEYFAVLRNKLTIGNAGLDENTGAYNFSAPGDSVSDYVSLKPAIDELARMAAANGITIFTLQPEMDLRVSAPGDPIKATGGVLSIGALALPDETPSLEIVQLATGNSKNTLQTLADKTGGKFFAGGEHADDAMRQIALDVSSYYSLAYRASTEFDKPHKVTVRVKNRPELNVRARNEVVRKSAPREMNDRLVAGLLTDSMKNELGIAARQGEPRKGDKRGHSTIDVDVIIPLSKLTFVRDGNSHRARFTVHYAITGDDTGFISGIEPEQLVDIPNAEFGDARTKIWRHTLHIDVDKKGEYQAAVGVLDALSQTPGMAALRMEVP